MATAESHTIELTPFQNGNLKAVLEVPDTLNVLGQGEAIPEGSCVFRILHQKHGDKRITWMKDSLQQIRDAKELFLKMVKEGLAPFRVGTGGKASSEAMSEFDPAAEEVIFVPIQAVRGG